MPDFLVIGGPNGAGKSTAAPALLRDLLRVVEFVNTDTVAQGLSAFAPEAAAVQAGRLVLRRLADLGRQGRDFAFESTLSGRSLAKLVGDLAGRGYRFHLFYLWLPSVETAVARVAERVRAGGHAVPEADVRRRHGRSLVNFYHLYRPLANTWECYENSGVDPLLVARGEGHTVREVRHPARWRLIEEAAHGRFQDLSTPEGP